MFSALPGFALTVAIDDQERRRNYRLIELSILDPQRDPLRAEADPTDMSACSDSSPENIPMRTLSFHEHQARRSRHERGVIMVIALITLAVLLIGAAASHAFNERDAIQRRLLRLQA